MKEEEQDKENLTSIPLIPAEYLHCAPDDTEIKGKLIDEYFQRVIDLLGYDQKAIEAFLNIESHEIYFEGTDGEMYPTDDRITTLSAHGTLVAFAFETRDAGNFIDFSLVCTITEDSIGLLRIKDNVYS